MSEDIFCDTLAHLIFNLVRGRPFDSEGGGGGGLALFGNKYSDLENDGNKSFVLFWKENK